MFWPRLISTIALAAPLTWCAGPPERPNNEASAAMAPANVRSPRVLRALEPADNRVVRLPGPPSKTLRRPAFVVPARNLLATGKLPPLAPAVAMAPLVLVPPALKSFFSIEKPPAIVYPDAFQADGPAYLQSQIGKWQLAEASALLGPHLRQRVAVDDDQTPNGLIYAFPDPTSRYRELELDFDKDKGLLRTVFVYPWNMTWQESQRLWGSKVNATAANRGRLFYSYVDRRLDVLVAPDGKVISFGLY